MRIEQGNYILNSDPLKNMWIEEKYIGETKDKQPKEAVRRLTGYFQDFASLSRDFLKKSVTKNDTTEIEKVLSDLNIAENEIEEIYKKYKKELITLE